MDEIVSHAAMSVVAGVSPANLLNHNRHFLSSARERIEVTA